MGPSFVVMSSKEINFTRPTGTSVDSELESCQMPASLTAVALQPNPKKVSRWKKFHSGMIRALNVSREEGFDSRKTLSPFLFTHKEDKSLRHVAMVAKFPEDHKPKTSLKKWIRTVSNFNDLIQFHLTCQMLAKFSGVESERTVSKLRKRKRKFCVGFTYSTKQARVIRKFYVAVVQRRLRHVQFKTAWCTCKVVVLLLYIMLLLFSVHVAVAVVVT